MGNGLSPAMAFGMNSAPWGAGALAGSSTMDPTPPKRITERAIFRKGQPDYC